MMRKKTQEKIDKLIEDFEKKGLRARFNYRNDYYTPIWECSLTKMWNAIGGCHGVKFWKGYGKSVEIASKNAVREKEKVYKNKD